MIWIPHKYQEYSLQHVKDNKWCGLFLDMGLGKTAVLLTAIDYFMNRDFEIRKTLVIAPLKVAETVWTDERDKWDHLKRLKISLVLGDHKARLEALKKPADVYVINYNNIAWLVNHYMTAWPFDMVTYDESAGFKNQKSLRFRAMKMVQPFIKRRVIMTGTPVPNGLADLWAQLYLLDEGRRLGKHITDYRREYLTPLPSDGFETRKYNVTEHNAKRIYDKVSDICISMKAEDYLKLPDRIETVNNVVLPAATMKRYKQFEKEQVLKAWEEGGKDIAAVNAGALVTKLRQFANGAIYDNEGKTYQVIHDHKIEMVEELIEAAQGESVLVAYHYKHDVERMQKKLGGRIYQKGDAEKWNAGKIPLMYLQSAGGIGLNLQGAGAIVAWFGQTYNLMDWQQYNARLYRQGRLKPVNIHKIICPGTIDTKIMRSINNKDSEQVALLDAVKALISEHIK